MVTLDDIKKLKNDVSILNDKSKKLQELTNEYIKINAVFNKGDLVLVCGDTTKIYGKRVDEFYITTIDCIRLFNDKIQYGYIDNVNKCGSFVNYISLDAEIILLKPVSTEHRAESDQKNLYYRIKNKVNNFLQSL